MDNNKEAVKLNPDQLDKVAGGWEGGYKYIESYVKKVSEDVGVSHLDDEMPEAVAGGICPNPILPILED